MHVYFSTSTAASVTISVSVSSASFQFLLSLRCFIFVCLSLSFFDAERWAPIEVASRQRSAAGNNCHDSTLYQKQDLKRFLLINAEKVSQSQLLLFFLEARDVEKRIATQKGQAITASGPTRTRFTGRAETRRTWAWHRSVRARRRAGGTRASSTEATKLRRLVRSM